MRRATSPRSRDGGYSQVDATSGPSRRSSAVSGRYPEQASQAQSPKPPRNGMPSPGIARSSRSSILLVGHPVDPSLRHADCSQDGSMPNGVHTTLTNGHTSHESAKKRTTGVVDECYCSRLPMNEFLASGMRIHWPQKSGSGHQTFERTFPWNCESKIGRTDKCLVWACKVPLVNKAERSHEEMVAVKQIFGKKADSVGQAERKALRNLSHPHVVAFLDNFTCLGMYCIVMYPVARWHLAHYMQLASAQTSDVGSPEPRRLKMLRQLRTFMPCLCEALHYLHLKRVRHRDIKPKNILIDYHMNVLIADFGTATQFEEEDDMETSALYPMRTKRYAAPETWERTPRGPKSDLFSLGCVFLEMVTVLCGANVEILHQELGFRPNPVGDGEALLGAFAKALPQIHAVVTKLEGELSKGDIPEHYGLQASLLTSIAGMLKEKPADRPALETLRQQFAVPWQKCSCANLEACRLVVGKDGISDIAQSNVARSIKEQKPEVPSTIAEERETSPRRTDNVQSQQLQSAGPSSHIATTDWAPQPESRTSNADGYGPHEMSGKPSQNRTSPTKPKPLRLESHSRKQSANNVGQEVGDNGNRSPPPSIRSHDRRMSSLANSKPGRTSRASGELLARQVSKTPSNKPISVDQIIRTGTPTEDRAAKSDLAATPSTTLSKPLSKTSVIVWRLRPSRREETKRGSLHGNKLFVYDCIAHSTTVADIATFDWDQPGFLLRLPPRSSVIHYPPREQVDLWQHLSWIDHLKRGLGFIKYVWVAGKLFTDDELRDYFLT